jgi:hypothetical protein
MLAHHQDWRVYLNDLTTLLRANGVFSAGSGLALLSGAALLDDALGLEAWFLAMCGLTLIGYGGTLWKVAQADDPHPAGHFASIMDAAWVLGALMILLGFPSAMSALGRLSLLSVSAVVAGFAILQIRTLRLSTHGPA